jgi:hypothetical protein
MFRSINPFTLKLRALGLATGLALGLIGLALSANLVSLRALLAEQGYFRALLWTSQVRTLLGDESSHGLEALCAGVGLAILTAAIVALIHSRATRRPNRPLPPLVNRLSAPVVFVLVSLVLALSAPLVPAAEALVTEFAPLRSVLLGGPGAAVSPRTVQVPGAPAALLAAAAPGDAAITVSGMRLSATFNSIGIELPFTGDANADTTASVQFRGGSSGWRDALPLWATDDRSGPAFYGSILRLEPGTNYEVRVQLRDPNGVNGPSELTGSIATRPENIPPASDLAPTHFVRADGDDGNDGASEASAWRTIEQAFAAAPDGAVVQLGPGFYLAPSAPRLQPMVLVAQYPAVDEARNPINEGARSVIEPAHVSAPAGSGEANAGVWQQVSLPGPDGRGYTVWAWPNSGARGSNQLRYARTRTELPLRVAHWRPGGADLRSPAGWAFKLYNNRTYNYGFFVDGQDVYLRLPGDQDPNSLYITVLGDDEPAAGLSASGPNIRFSGLEIRGFHDGVALDDRATFTTIDHCYLAANFFGVNIKGTSPESRGQAAGSSPSTYGSDHLIQFNRFEDTGVWSEDPSNPTIPWRFIKGSIRNADGSAYGTPRLGAQSEGVAVSGRGGGQRVVVRYNTILGTFNGVSPGYQPDFDRYAGMDMDVHDNYLSQIPDDAFEPEDQAINFRVWGNRVENATVVLSTGPVNYGPIYFFRNEAWNIGTNGVGREESGELNLGGIFFKRSDAGKPPARVYVVNNTFWTDQPQVPGGARYAGAGGPPERFFLRNNIFRVTHYAFDLPPNQLRQSWDEDYNHFFTNDPRGRGLKYGDRNFDSMDGYRRNSGQGEHSNLSGGPRTADPALGNPAAGDLSLPPGSPFIDAGVVVPNIVDRPGVDFSGAAPDLGARER